MHTGFPRGKRVLAILRNGERFVAKFDQTDYARKQMLFLDHEPVTLSKLRAVSIVRVGDTTTSPPQLFGRTDEPDAPA